MKMSSRMNGYDSERMIRPSSEQMADLHVYMVPPDIWREKFNNALNQHINDTVSLGFIRVHPETKVYALRDEIEQQLGSDLVPREFVFLKSVGRSLTRLKSKQEASMKVKHFLPPQAYAPELYLLEATPEVRQAIAASSEGSTRPETRTSYDFEYARQSDDQSAKRSHMHNGVGLNSYYPTLPKIPTHTESSPLPQQGRKSSLSRSSPQIYQNPPINFSKTPGPKSLPDPEAKTDEQFSNTKQEYNDNKDDVRPSTPHYSDPKPHTSSEPRNSYPTQRPPEIVLTEWDENSENISDTHNLTDPSFNQTGPAPASLNHAINRPGADLRTSHTSSDPHPDPPHHMVNSPRRGPTTEKPFEEQYLPPLSATPPHSAVDKIKRNNQSNRNNHDEDSGIAGFSPDTYRGNDSQVLDRRKEGDDRHPKITQPPQTNRSDHYPPPAHQGKSDDEDQSKWETDRNYEDTNRQSPEMVRQTGRLEEEEEDKAHVMERHQIEEEVKKMKNPDDEDLTRYPSPPPLRLASPDRESESAKERKRKEREELLKQLEEAREERKNAERMREELVKQAKLMQNKTQNKRNHARDIWKKRYFEEKKRTGPLEDQMNKLRHELDIIHKRLLSTLEGPKEKATKLGDMKNPHKGPAHQKPLNNFKVQATRLQHEIEDIRRRVEHAKMRLTSEMKLRNQAETELRALRAELTQKKINLTLSRNSNLTTYAPPAADVNLISSRTKAITPRS